MERCENNQILDAFNHFTYSAQPRVRRQPVAKVLETVTERLEPQEKLCPPGGKAKCEIGCEKSERFEYVPSESFGTKSCGLSWRVPVARVE
jgi:hypothetical protein